MTSLAGRTVLVTGANRGMGREYIGQLLDRGATKVYAAARDPRTIEATDARVVPLQLDVTDATSIAEAAVAASDVSVLINNAGIARGASVLDRDTTKLREELETNLFGPLAMASTFADRIAARSGAIVNVASVLAWMPVGASYGVSKAAMWSATDSMRTELAPRGVQVVGVYIGLVDTDMAKFSDYPKSDPADVIRQVLDGIESGADEVLADEMTRDVRAHLNKPIHERSPGVAQADVGRTNAVTGSALT
jgi:NAD(P)-dependent dehydrogenase (short-subunit alcohol dehydrogenase family)